MCSEVRFMINVSGKIENNKKKNIIENIINVFNVKEDVYGDAYIGYPVYSLSLIHISEPTRP